MDELRWPMKKVEIIFSIVAVVAVATMIGYRFWKNKAVDANPVYVLAKVYSIHDTENGLIYSFKYYFDGVEYDDGLKGFVQLQDSVMLLKISKANPKLWRHFEGRIAKCLTNDTLLRKSWSELPYCK